MADQLTVEIIAAIKNLAQSENGGRIPVAIGEITADSELTSLGIDSWLWPMCSGTWSRPTASGSR